MNPLRLLFGVLCFCIAAATPLSAQVTTATLTGSVVDENGEPLIGANVVAIHVPSGTQYGITTRVDGQFTLPNLRVGGPYTVQSSYVGYKTKSYENINLSLAQKLNLKFQMEGESVELSGVVVYG